MEPVTFTVPSASLKLKEGESVIVKASVLSSADGNGMVKLQFQSVEAAAKPAPKLLPRKKKVNPIDYLKNLQAAAAV